MVVVPHAVLKEFIYNIYLSAGAVEEDAQIVANHLVESNLMGHDSHGVIRTDFYINTMKVGPASDRMEIVRETPTSAVINVNDALGMVAAKHAMSLAIKKAKTHTLGAVALHNCGHAGRMLGRDHWENLFSIHGDRRKSTRVASRHHRVE